MTKKKKKKKRQFLDKHLATQDLAPGGSHRIRSL